MYILDRRFFMTQCKTSAAISFRVWIGKKLWFWIHYLFMPHYLPKYSQYTWYSTFCLFFKSGSSCFEMSEPIISSTTMCTRPLLLSTTPFLIFFNLWESLSDRFLVYDFFCVTWILLTFPFVFMFVICGQVW